MLDEMLLQKIINCQLSIRALKNFYQAAQNENGFDHSFDKYFSLERIENAINLYRAKKISNKYLIYWACVYNWILMVRDDDYESFTKANLIENMRGLINRLSLLNETEKSVKEKAKYLDKIMASIKLCYFAYKNQTAWQVYYQENFSYVDKGVSLASVILLLANHNTKSFFTIDGFAKSTFANDAQLLSEAKFANKKTELLKAGYQLLEAG